MIALFEVKQDLEAIANTVFGKCLWKLKLEGAYHT